MPRWPVAAPRGPGAGPSPAATRPIAPEPKNCLRFQVIMLAAPCRGGSHRRIFNPTPASLSIRGGARRVRPTPDAFSVVDDEPAVDQNVLDPCGDSGQLVEGRAVPYASQVEHEQVACGPCCPNLACSSVQE